MEQIAPPTLRPAPPALARRTQVLMVLALALAIAAALGLASVSTYLFRGPSQSEAKPIASPGTFTPTPAQFASLNVAQVTTMNFRSEKVTDGKIAINNDKTTPVFSPYSGRVTKILAQLGDTVKQGAPLLALEASEFAQGQNDLVAAASALRTARSQVNLTQINEKRKQALYEAKGGSLQDWQQSQADLVTAQNNLRSAETALALVRNRLRILGKTDAQIDALQNAQKMDPVANVLAPISGTVTDRQVGLGQYIQSGASNPLYSIGDLSTVWLIANVRQQDAPSMRLGAPVEVRVLAFPGRVFKAKLTYVAPAVDPNTRRLPVRAEVENPDGALKPEMFANFSIITGGESTAPAVPEEAIVHDGEAARVWVMQEGGTIASRQIRTGRISNGMVEILAGVTPGERVVTSGTLFIDRAVKRD